MSNRKRVLAAIVASVAVVAGCSSGELEETRAELEQTQRDLMATERQLDEATENLEFAESELQTLNEENERLRQDLEDFEFWAGASLDEMRGEIDRDGTGLDDYDPDALWDEAMEEHFGSVPENPEDMHQIVLEQMWAEMSEADRGDVCDAVADWGYFQGVWQTQVEDQAVDEIDRALVPPADMAYDYFVEMCG